MRNVLDKIQSSFWIKAITATAFLMMLYGNNSVKISNVESASKLNDERFKAETLEISDKRYVRKDVFDLLLTQISDIKNILNQMRGIR